MFADAARPLFKLVPLMRHRLDTYAYPACAQNFCHQLQRQHHTVSYMLDSGAFTAWRTGKELHWRQYLAFAERLHKTFCAHFTDFHLITLDTIGDQAATMRTYAMMRGTDSPLAERVVPVLTLHADEADLDPTLEAGYEAGMLCLGGLVFYAQARGRLQVHLDRVFARVVRRWKATGQLLKIHTLGVGRPWMFQRYPLYSCDMSSWSSPQRFGRGLALRHEGLPGYDLPKQTTFYEPTILTMRTILNEMAQQEDAATQLWKSRGITFDETYAETPG